jgi:uncharacterized caspase-like protein
MSTIQKRIHRWIQALCLCLLSSTFAAHGEICKFIAKCPALHAHVTPNLVTSAVTSIKPATTTTSASSTQTTITKPRATVTAVANPFVKVNSAVIVQHAGTATAWRAVMFKSANVALDQNPSAAALPNCAAGQDGNCIASAPERRSASTNGADKDNDNIPAKPIERRRALVIGNTEYASPMTSLPGTAKDAADISKSLADQGFEVVSLADASREGTVRAFNNLIRTTGEDDSVIIYYAGHGHIHPGSASGYWLPADADVENPKTWISNTDISRMLTNIGAKQILLVSDSCFSGALTREAEAPASNAKPISTNAILKRRSVAVMSSGGEEPVADSVGEGNSPFADALLKKLSDLSGTKETLRAQVALDDIRTTVSKNSSQTPQYGVLMSAGHTAGGDYLFGGK